MKTALVGYTGFVGSNLMASYEFTSLYNTKNIQQAFGTEPELLVFSGLPAAMFKANSNPEEDFEKVSQAIENISAIKAKRIVLISTVAVYDKTIGVDETYTIDEKSLLPYGRNRLFFENWIRENNKDNLIIRLPAIYGINLKKNFIFDYINLIPSMLNEKKYQELADGSELIKSVYSLNEDGYYHFTAVGDDRKKAYKYFNASSFNALSFTDSRSVYQFYGLNNLWRDIQIALKSNIKLLNIVTEPLSVAEVYRHLSGKSFDNELNKPPYNYDIKSIHAELYSGKNGYLLDKEQVLFELKKFVDKEIIRIWG